MSERRGGEYLQPTAKLRKLWLLNEVHKNPAISQQELAARIGVTPAMVNNYIKTLEKEGHLAKVGASSHQMQYRLTDAGERQKDESYVLYMWELIQKYRNAKLEIRKRFQVLRLEGVQRVLFYGAGNACEVAAVAIAGTDLDLVGIVDDDSIKHGRLLHGVAITSPASISALRPDAIVITSIVQRQSILEKINMLGTPARVVTL